MKEVLNIVTRKSALAMWQANFVRTQLEKLNPRLQVNLIGLTTTADRHKQANLATMGGKSLYVKELQTALLNHEADIAVHSIKDLPVYEPDNLILAAICERADPRDVFIGKQNSSLGSLPHAAIVGTGSPRRKSQLKAIRPDLIIELLRGNVETRLKKLATQNYDAIILAAAGLCRLGLANHISEYLDPESFIPAIGQGAIGIECRADDTALLDFLQPLNHEPTYHCILAERAVNQKLGGNCFVPLAAHAHLLKNKLYLKAMVGMEDGSLIFKADLQGELKCAQSIGLEVAEKLLQQGADKILKKY